jgi:adenylylsulfate kinase-like enzyme
VWFTGLSGSGKSTIANLVDKRLHAMGHHTFLLDGDNVRHGLNRTSASPTRTASRTCARRRSREADDRRRADRAGELHLAVPCRAAMARELVREGEFIEVFVDTPLARRRAARRQGPLREGAPRRVCRNFTGIDSPYEAPEAPELHLDTTGDLRGSCWRSRWCAALARSRLKKATPRASGAFLEQASSAGVIRRARGRLPRIDSQTNSNTMARGSRRPTPACP